MCWSQERAKPAKLSFVCCRAESWSNNYSDEPSVRSSCYCRSCVQFSYEEKENAFQYFNTNIDMMCDFIQKRQIAWVSPAVGLFRVNFWRFNSNLGRQSLERGPQEPFLQGLRYVKLLRLDCCFLLHCLKDFVSKKWRKAANIIRN